MWAAVARLRYAPSCVKKLASVTIDLNSARLDRSRQSFLDSAKAAQSPRGPSFLGCKGGCTMATQATFATTPEQEVTARVADALPMLWEAFRRLDAVPLGVAEQLLLDARREEG